VALRARAQRPAGASETTSPAPEHPAVTAPPPDAPQALAGALPAFPDAATLAAAPRQSSGRPAPTRAATLAAYRNALSAAAPPPMAAPLAPSAAVAAPAIAPVLAVARWPTPPPMTRPAPLARVETDAPPAQNGSAPQPSAKPEPPDLDALADHVLERLRHELRDGRERLGYLLDDLR
jgi:hypothetical protein